MKVPHPPDSDNEVNRHKFYGAISSSLECLNDKIDSDDIQIKENNIELHNRYHKLKGQLEEIHVRINRRVYEDDYNQLKTQVHALSKHEVAHRTAWATGKTFIFGAWIVFAVLFGAITTLSQKTLDDYLSVITTNEKLIGKLENKSLLVDTALMENKVFHAEKRKLIEDLEEKHRYLEDSLQGNYSKLNKLNNTVNQLEVKIEKKVDRKN